MRLCSDDFSKRILSCARADDPSNVYSRCYSSFVDRFTVRRYGRAAVHRPGRGLLTQRHLLHYGTASKARVKGRWASTLPARSSERTDVGRRRRQARASPLFGSPSLFCTRHRTVGHRTVRPPTPHAVNWFFKRAGHRVPRATYLPAALRTSSGASSHLNGSHGPTRAGVCLVSGAGLSRAARGMQLYM